MSTFSPTSYAWSVYAVAGVPGFLVPDYRINLNVDVVLPVNVNCVRFYYECYIRTVVTNSVQTGDEGLETQKF
ncbi:hypothetical protein GOBAR_AA18170 [Gossypium barbadense]|uniref:Uncharacterized protein n=1 Tax=Gossypium barbadense TaxID=3634 RepID=A0A2P5XGM4_GOSBA|nr:hypothetical protein GOBAR_AA18170 [Gossypium barbadense]